MEREDGSDAARGLAELSEIYVTAFDNCIRTVTRELINLETDSHPRIRALAIFLEAGDAIETRQRLVRYALQTFGFELMKGILESEKLNLSYMNADLEVSLITNSNYDVQMTNDWCYESSDFGDAYSEIDLIAIDIERSRN